MKDIQFFINEVEKISFSKKNINDLKDRINHEIKEIYCEISKCENLKYSKELNDLTNAKKFLENYPSYLKKGIKGFYKNIISTIQVFCCSLPIIFILIVLSCIETSGISLEILLSYGQVSLFLSFGLCIFCNFIHPIIFNYNEKKLLLKKYESINNIDLLIEETKKNKKENNKKIELLKDKISIKKENINELDKKLEQLGLTEENYYSIIDKEYIEILSSIAKERYLYNCALEDNFKLTLKK